MHLHGERDAPVLVLGHGAGGGAGILSTPDLLAATGAALALGVGVALVEQPWHVAGRRVAEAPVRLDAAWLAVLAELVAGRPHVVGGRSAGARVACRTAAATGALGVLALAFPLTPVGRPERSRLAELALPTVPVQVVQGSRDAFGIPPPAVGRAVDIVEGADHGFAVRRRDAASAPVVAAAVARSVTALLHQVLRGLPGSAADVDLGGHGTVDPHGDAVDP